MEKVLVIGPSFYGYNFSVEKAFKNLGFDTKVLTFYEGEVKSQRERIEFHFSKDKVNFFEKKRKDFNIIFRKTYDDYKPNIVFIIKGSWLNPESIIYAKNSINILWMMDSIFRNNYCLNLRKTIDHIFLFEETDVHRLKEEDNIASYFLPLALDETVYFPIDAKKEIDLLFVGMLYEDRIKLLNRVVEAFPNKNIKIYGQFFSPLRKPFKYLFRKDKHVFTNTNIEPSLLNKLYSKTKVCLNIHHHQSKIGVNQRFFEILGSRSLEISDAKPFIENNFTQDELLWYHNEDEMIEKIKMALENYNTLGEKIEKGYQKVRNNHTFTNRIEYVLDKIGYIKEKDLLDNSHL